GRRYAHILDPVTGLPTKTNILSVSVISESCMIADAYATALHLMNMNEIEYFLSKNNDVSAYIIYENEKMEITGKTFNNFIIR
ncbi:MAG TPA: FAD:protein FMN transferase, partial [Flavobacteriaceae bacterium]|nr:FAD:protein FMN transferase [Flavobacteriaceae bacterium]